MNRRKLLALGGAVGAAGFAGWLNERGNRIWKWSGKAFRTDCSILFLGERGIDPQEIMEKAYAKIVKLEAIFSLSAADSPISRLNRDGKLSDPPYEFIDALKLSREVHEMTDGAFDPTVQPLWELYDQYFKANPDAKDGPPGEKVAEARSKLGFEKVRFDDGKVEFADPGMALTLNGLSQGFVSEKIARYLLGLGITHALVNLGEFCALGPPPGEDGWTVGIAAEDGIGGILDQKKVVYGGLATSAGSGYRFDQDGHFHHIFDPLGTGTVNGRRMVTVEAPDAGLADALATAGAVMDWKRFRRLQLPMLGLRFHLYES